MAESLPLIFSVEEKVTRSRACREKESWCECGSVACEKSTRQCREVVS